VRAQKQFYRHGEPTQPGASAEETLGLQVWCTHACRFFWCQAGTLQCRNDICLGRTSGANAFRFVSTYAVDERWPLRAYVCAAGRSPWPGRIKLSPITAGAPPCFADPRCVQSPGRPAAPGAMGVAYARCSGSLEHSSWGLAGVSDRPPGVRYCVHRPEAVSPQYAECAGTATYIWADQALLCFEPRLEGERCGGYLSYWDVPVPCPYFR